MALQYVADRACRHGKSQIAQRRYYSLVAPTWILARHAQHPFDERLRHRWSTGAFSRIRPLLGDKLAVPRQKRIRREQYFELSKAHHEINRLRSRPLEPTFRVDAWPLQKIANNSKEH